MTGTFDRLTAALADRYRIERELGAGGMATVYLAEDIKHQRKVAIKVLRPELAAVIGAERFLAEIRTTANLQHPHILPLHDSGEAGGSVFYVMTYIEGESLRARLEHERQLPIAEAVQIVLDVAGALDYAHRHGVVHRDIKPENILLHDGRAVVADFGIALAATSAGSRMTETGMSLGTPTYMSPEQAMGERTLDGRTDVYALGCVLYELLVGAPPFVGPTAQAIVAKVLTERPQPPSAVRDTVSPAIDAVLLTALAKLPADRQPSAAAFSEALRAAMQAGVGPQATQAYVPRPATGAGSSGVSRGRLAAVGLSGALVGAVALAGITRLLDARRPEQTTERRVQLTFDGNARQPAISADGRFIAYTTLSCSGGPEVPCQASLHVQELGGSRPITLLADAQDIGRPRWTRDGAALVYAAQLDNEQQGIYTIPRLGGDARLISTRTGVLDLHARGDSLVVLDGSWAVVLDLARGQAHDSLPVSDVGARGVAWSPDGRFLAVNQNYSRLLILARDGSGSDSLLITARPSVAWSPGGRSVLLFAAREGTSDDLVHVPVSADGRLAVEPLILLSKEATSLYGEFDVARDAGTLAILGGSVLYDYWRVRTDREGSAERLTEGTAWYGAPTLSPDGSRVFYPRGDGIGDNLYVLEADGRERALTREPYPGSTNYRIAADGRRILFSHTLPTGQRISEMRLPSGDVRHLPMRPSAVLGDPAPVGSRGLVFITPELDSLLIADSLGAATRSIAVGAGRRAVIVAAGPRDDEVFVYTVRRAGGRSEHELLRVPLGGGAVERLATLPGPVLTLDVGADRSPLYSRWVAGERSISVWRLPSGGGPAVRVVSMPSVCTAGRMSVASAAPVAVCTAAVRRTDVWVVDGVLR